MPRYFPDDELRRLRNQIAFQRLFAQLNWPHKERNNQVAFLCPSCGEYQSAVNPRTNLARCFRCQTNFNQIDFTIAVQHCDFAQGVHYLKPLLPPPNDLFKPC